ncbi:exonuclease V [Emydura macquarii macquarii]|uniref:exonuclease V n=1 Tax=Emydura macquarii macquarii TaxID=1129001 RepID=UPI00352A28C2
MEGPPRSEPGARGAPEPSDSELLQLLLEGPGEEALLLRPGDSGKPSSSNDLPLESFNEVFTGDGAAQKVKRKRAQTPLEKYDLKYLYVTDLSTQSWCEQQMVYGREQPQLQAPETIVLLNTGKSIHLARELEVHDVVKVQTTSKEDSWAIRILNLLSVIPVLQAGGCVRELPVFGVIEDVFLIGIIDELCYNANGELELRELKTRGRPSMPSGAQKKKDYFQVCLYKYMFDAMVRGQLKPDVITSHVHLRPDQPLGLPIRKHAQKAGFMVTCFGDLLELMYLNLTLSDIPSIDLLKIEYSHQESHTLLGTEVVQFAEEKVRERAQYYLAYWKGQREVQGVEIEEAWKCYSCVYSEICDWRKKRAEGLVQRSGPKKSK